MPPIVCFILAPRAFSDVNSAVVALPVNQMVATSIRFKKNGM